MANTPPAQVLRTNRDKDSHPWDSRENLSAPGNHWLRASFRGELYLDGVPGGFQIEFVLR